MKFSENWLRSLVRVPAGRAELVERLTMSGLEVAGVEPLGDSLDGVVVARIVACEPHPDADRLRVCTVATGAGEVQIVCGAPNARTGLVAPLATPGAKLPNGAAIKVARLRGVESAGMLCSAAELGVDADASGLMELSGRAPVGTPLAEYLGLPDASIEVELTPNRGDCLGMLGLADEVAAEFGAQAKPFEAPRVEATVSARRAIRLEAGAACPRYLGRAVRDIDVAAPTPVWMAQRLRAAGVKPINAVVDVTNYVMLEMGQPLHAFDERKLDGDLAVRPARAGEVLKLLDGRDATLDSAFVLIVDAAKPLAAAGVMGGFDSRVTATTHDVFLEAAHFAPAAIMGRARRLGLATDAAHRFERGVDPEAPHPAIERATALLLEIAGGKPGEIIEAALPDRLRAPSTVTLRSARIARVLGIVIEAAEVKRILVALGMRVEERPDGWCVTPPSRRFDIALEEDLIEEIARIHGYDRIPARLPPGSPPQPHADETVLPVHSLDACLAARDYREAICYAFLDPGLLEMWQLDRGAVPLANPLSTDLAVMRTSLLPGLVEAMRRNRNRQQARVRLFEVGTVFRDPAPARGPDAFGESVPASGDLDPDAYRGDRPAGGSARTVAGRETAGVASRSAPPERPAPVETSMLAAVACGNARAEQWGDRKRPVDFFDLKGDLEAMIALSGTPESWSFEARELPPWLHPGRSARVLRDGVAVGVVGALHPALQQKLDLPESYVLEVESRSLCKRLIPNADILPRFPSIRRDIAIEVDEEVEWARLARTIRSALPTLTELVLFDDFHGPGLSKGRKSLAIGLILQDSSHTLTDEDADQAVAGVIGLLGREFGAKLRG